MGGILYPSVYTGGTCHFGILCICRGITPNHFGGTILQQIFGVFSVHLVGAWVIHSLVDQGNLTFHKESSNEVTDSMEIGLRSTKDIDILMEKNLTVSVASLGFV